MMTQFPSFFLLLFCFSFFFSLITSPRTLYMFPIALIWHVFATFGFVIMDLHFATTFTIAMT